MDQIKVIGTARVVHAPLDSRRFGIEVARADGVSAEDVGRLVSFCDQHCVDLLIARCDADDDAAVAALRAAAFDLCDIQARYRGPLPPGTWRAGTRHATPDDCEAIAALANRCFADFPSHYHADQRLSRDACRDVYVDWSLRCVDDPDATVILADAGSGITAFSAYRLDGAVLTWVLAASDPGARGPQQLEIGHSAMAWARERGANEVVASMLDVPKRHRYAVRTGLVRVGRTATFHGWRDAFGGDAAIAAAGPLP